MATIKLEQQAAQSLTVTGLSTLAAGNYAASAEIVNSNDPIDVLIEVTAATTNTIGGGLQVLVFAKGSLDGTNFGSGPESSSSTTDEPDLHYLGSLPLRSASTDHRKIFSLASAFGGVLPAKSKLVFKNDLNVALTSGSVKTAEIIGVSV